MATAGVISTIPIAGVGYPMPTTTHTPANYSGVLASGSFVGAITRSTPYIAGNARTGIVPRGYFSECLANKIIPIPPTINFGIVSQPVTLPGVIWNTHDHGVTLGALSINAEGVTINRTVGLFIPAFVDATINYTAVLDGAAIIDGDIVFTFDTSQTATVRTAGLRGLLFLYRPREGYEESDHFSTNIFRSLNGSEKRESYIDTSKKSFRYRVSADSAEEFAELQNKIHASAKVPVFQPIWTSEAQLKQATSGITTIYVDTVSTDITIGDLLIFYQSETAFDIRRVTGKGSGQVTVDTAPAINFPAGTLCIPARVAYMAQAVPFEPHYDHWGAHTMFDIEAREV